jgi:hypothetical protein
MDFYGEPAWVCVPISVGIIMVRSVMNTFYEAFTCLLCTCRLLLSRIVELLSLVPVEN